jgi:dissimilatory sulfite reductase (desulfoviridin) alpha/beta subunit
VITQEQRKAVKAKGFLSNRDGEHFSVRIITGNGVLKSEQMRCICETAEKYGNGDITFTSRMTVELPGIRFDDIEAVQRQLAKENLKTGGTGAKVRPVVACKGTVCTFGNIDTQGLASEIHERFFEGYAGVMLPHKFKIGIGGCPNNCVKPDLNDIGIVGQKKPVYDSSLCRGCAKCAVITACPMKACGMTDKTMTIDRKICSNCGRCVGKCSFKAITGGEILYKIYIGGRWGKKIRIGTALTKAFKKDEALDIVEKAILFFRKEGITGERFADTIERIGIGKTEEALTGDRLLEEKNAIISAELNT